MHNDLHRLDTLEVTKIVWDTFAELARSSDLKEYFNLEGFADPYGTPTSVYEIAFLKWKPQESEVRIAREVPSFTYVVRKVYYSAVSMGLIIPGRVTQTLEYSKYGKFQFTSQGIKYFSNGFISIDDPGYLGIALKELQKKLPVVDDGIIELLLESQRCIKAGCYRAGMVVIGVANEDMCIALLESISINCNAPNKKSASYSDWNSCNDTTLSFSETVETWNQDFRRN